MMIEELWFCMYLATRGFPTWDHRKRMPDSNDRKVSTDVSTDAEPIQKSVPGSYKNECVMSPEPVLPYT